MIFRYRSQFFPTMDAPSIAFGASDIRLKVHGIRMHPGIEKRK
jgi:hypothetical protein